ncbi:MAG TPA: hypothetical protein VG895_02615 [Patescibacteria group bacterium]|nr:hypothetical protein [Patescibacteria group bacterium]
MRTYKSRLSEVENKNAIKSTLIYGGLTLLIIVWLIAFGIPLFSKFLNIVNKPGSAPVVTSKQTVLPPNLSSLPQFTNIKTATVSGTAMANATVKIFTNNSSTETQTDQNGNFSTYVNLTNGQNTIYAQTVDSNGNTSSNTSPVTITYTNQVPNLTISSPQNNQTFYGSTQQNISIQGSTDPNNTITINDHIAILDGGGNFNYPFVLQNGQNTIKVISTDQAGNTKEIDLTVTFNP